MPKDNLGKFWKKTIFKEKSWKLPFLRFFKVKSKKEKKGLHIFLEKIIDFLKNMAKIAKDNLGN